jgi:hypothetical protein
MIWHIQVSIRTKCSLIAILSLKIFACVAGIMKSTYNKNILTDPRWFIHDWYSMWNFIELGMGIIAASLPALKPLFTRFLDAARGLASGQTGNGIQRSKIVISTPNRRIRQCEEWCWDDNFNVSTFERR